MTIKQKYLQSQKGFTLLESMISLVILSVGLLGVASMQSLGLRLSHDAFLRTQATILAHDIAEKMRLDPVNALKQGGDNPYDGSITAASSDTACTSTSISPSDALVCWQVTLREQLGTGLIAITAPNAINPSTITLNISWSDSWIEKGATAASSSFQTFTFQIHEAN